MASSMGAADVRARDGRLAYFRLVEDKIELVTAPLDASSVDVVARFDPTSGFHIYPRWSPDGDRIAYQAGQMLNQEIYVVRCRRRPARPADPRCGSPQRVRLVARWLWPSLQCQPW